ncbi:MAG: hypothetical protein L0Y39_13270 [Methylococcaceae bacterium]|nr:hypothetical protein [Methylococcaceae bacterium]
MRVLLAEDDAMIAQALCEGLDQNGFVVDWARDGDQARLALATPATEYSIGRLGRCPDDLLQCAAGNRRTVRQSAANRGLFIAGFHAIGLDFQGGKFYPRTFRISI